MNSRYHCGTIQRRQCASCVRPMRGPGLCFASVSIWRRCFTSKQSILVEVVQACEARVLRQDGLFYSGAVISWRRRSLFDCNAS